jgi:hypothetical protein
LGRPCLGLRGMAVVPTSSLARKFNLGLSSVSSRQHVKGLRADLMGSAISTA